VSLTMIVHPYASYVDTSSISLIPALFGVDSIGPLLAGAVSLAEKWSWLSVLFDRSSMSSFLALAEWLFRYLMTGGDK
jgi:hypothetical protein